MEVCTQGRKQEPAADYTDKNGFNTETKQKATGAMQVALTFI